MYARIHNILLALAIVTVLTPCTVQDSVDVSIIKPAGMTRLIAEAQRTELGF
jgi:hypothetical protein